MGFRVKRVRRRGFRWEWSEVLVRVPRRDRCITPLLGGHAWVWGQASGRCRPPIAAPRGWWHRDGSGREWGCRRRNEGEGGDGRREEFDVWSGSEGASWAWLAGTHRGWLVVWRGLEVVALEDPKEQMTNLHRSRLRRSPPKWRSDFVVSEEVTSSSTFDAGW